MNGDLISREALMKFPIRRDHYDRVNGSEEYIFGVEAVLEYAENLPTVNSVKVMYCCECKHFEEDTGFCNLNGHGMLVDDFCSRGQRMAGDKDAVD